MAEITSLAKLTASSLTVNVIVSIKADQYALSLTDFIRQKTAEGLAIACWRKRDAAENFLARIPNGNTDFKLVEADGDKLNKMALSLGASPDRLLFVILD